MSCFALLERVTCWRFVTFWKWLKWPGCKATQESFGWVYLPKSIWFCIPRIIPVCVCVPVWKVQWYIFIRFLFLFLKMSILDSLMGYYLFSITMHNPYGIQNHGRHLDRLNLISSHTLHNIATVHIYHMLLILRLYINIYHHFIENFPFSVWS